jgi:hypothetical protein
MFPRLSRTIATAVLLLAANAGAVPSVSALAARLQNDSDFRIRVQTALELGRSESAQALAPLVLALDDAHASVRAAAAAALKILGDPAAVAALKRHRLDVSEAVRMQVQDSISALEVEPLAPPEKTKVFVKLTTVRNGTKVKSASIERAVLLQSRKNLDELPGVDVLPNDEEVAAAAEKQDIPVVLVTTSIQKLAAARDGDSVVYSANIEYLVHTMPDQTIAARVAGSASTSASETEAKDKAKSAELRREVVEAAVKSALKGAPRALLAAARR